LSEELALANLKAMARPSAHDAVLARILRDARLKSGLSQENAAHAAGITVGALARLERGETNPSWSTVRSVAEAVGLSMQALGKAVDADA
jgi:transcriptional regulator with XRE-family HTH domain